MFVSRDKNGNVTGTFPDKQPNHAEEWLEDDNPEIIAFLDSITPPPGPAVSEYEALKRALIKQGTITQQKIDDERR